MGKFNLIRINLKNFNHSIVPSKKKFQYYIQEKKKLFPIHFDHIK